MLTIKYSVLYAAISVAITSVCDAAPILGEEFYLRNAPELMARDSIADAILQVCSLFFSAVPMTLFVVVEEK